MIILGVDPGVAVTGYALLDITKNSASTIDYGCIKTSRTTSFPLRLKAIYDGITQLIDKYCPQVIVLEEVFYVQNIKTALKMGHVRAVTLLAAVNSDVLISEFSTREIKQSITGNGAASKQQVQRMVINLLNLSESSIPYDVTDAMAAAICHFHRKQKNQKFL